MNVVPLHRLDERHHPQALACAACEVRRFALFGALDAHGLDLIHENILSYDVAPDTVIHRAGDAGEWLFTIRHGIVRFERSTEAGERRIVRLAGRGDLIGQEALLGRRHGDDAVACTPVSVCRIPRHLLSELGETENSLVVELMHRWQLALDDAQTWISNLIAGPSLRRMLYLLQKLDSLADDQGLIWLPRRDDIGAMLDMTLETASRTISSLKREGLIELLPPHHARLDRAKLRHAIDALINQA